jgi:4-hydroxybenzoate polyprenyltransferase
VGEPASRSFLAAARLVHPFPSILDGLVVAIVAVIAGAGMGLAAWLGLSMTLLQFAIGTLNDIVDAPADAGRKPGKPIPGQARLVALACAGAGLGLAVLVSPALALVALLGLAVGAWYDLRAKGTALSWAPMAVGIPILPVYGWYGATGELPGMFLVVVPAAATAGAALAISNALVDLERDVGAGGTSIAASLGAGRAGLLGIGLTVAVVLLAVGAAWVLGAPGGWVAAVATAGLVPLACAGVGALAARRPGAGWREVAFEGQAVGLGLLAVAWLGALSAAAAAVSGA